LTVVEGEIGIGKSRLQDYGGGVRILQGQVWWVGGAAVELLGVYDGGWVVRRWVRSVEGRAGRPRVGEVLRMAAGSDCRGAGSEERLEGVIEGDMWRVFLGPDRVPRGARRSKGRDGRRLEATVVEVVMSRVEEGVVGEAAVPEWLRSEDERRKLRSIPDPVFFTDGSFVVEDGVRGLFDGPAVGTSCGAVVAMNASDWRRHPVVVWVFREPQGASSSAFDVESRMSCASADAINYLSRLRGTGGRIRSYTDCQSVVSRTEKGGFRSQAMRGHTPLMCHIGKRRKQSLDLQWTAAHPERRAGAWTFCDYGIHIADAAASGRRLGPEDFHGARDVTVHDREMVEAEWGVGRFGGWAWKEAGVILLRPLARFFSDWRKGEYLRERDRFRAEGGRDPEWEGMTVRFAASVRGVKEGLGSRARWNRIIFDKSWDGRNEGKGGGVVLPCPLCGEPDGMFHWLRECGSERMASRRVLVDREVREVFSSLRLGATRAVRAFLAAIGAVVFLSTTCHRAWCGLWTLEQVDALRDGAGALRGADVAAASKILKKIGRRLQFGVQEMWSERQARDTDPVAAGAHPDAGMRGLMRRWLGGGGDGVDWG
jgi:hypothetical protein